MPRVTITIPEKTPQPYRFDLLREIVTVGRGLDNDIVVGCGSVSGKHSEMHRVKGGYHLIDVGSTNGIKIDGIRHQTVVLHTGMAVKLGDVEFGFSLSEEELAVLASETEPATKPVINKDEELDEDDIDEEEISEKPVSKKDDSIKSDSKKDKDQDKKEGDDGPDKLPELPPVRLDKRKEKEDQEAEKRKKEERKEREKREARAEKEEKSERREKRERPAKSEKRDEYAESKAVTIGSGFILFTLIAAAAAFFYGANTRHEKDTGENLLKGIVNKEDAKNDAPTEVEDKPESGAE